MAASDVGRAVSDNASQLNLQVFQNICNTSQYSINHRPGNHSSVADAVPSNHDPSFQASCINLSSNLPTQSSTVSGPQCSVFADVIQ